MFSSDLIMNDLNKQYEELTERLSELNEYRINMVSQIDILNEQFKMDVIEKFSNYDVVEKIKKITFNGIGFDFNN